MSSLNQSALHSPAAKAISSPPGSSHPADRLGITFPRLVAKPASLRTKPGRPVTLEVENGCGGLGAPDVVIVTPPQHGTLHFQEIASLSPRFPHQAPNVSKEDSPASRFRLLRFHPDPGFVGQDSFSFRLANAFSQSEPATVSILVTQEYSAPVATPQSLKVKLGESLWINLGGTDEDNHPLELLILSQPAFGSLRVPDAADYFGPFCDNEEEIVHPFAPLPGVYIYEPYFPENLDALPPDWSPGTDQFSFAVSDGTTTSLPAKVSLAIRPFNHAPTGRVSVVEAVAAWSTPENAVVIASDPAGAQITLDASGSSDPDGDPLEIFLVPDETGPESATPQRRDALRPGNVHYPAVVSRASQDRGSCFQWSKRGHVHAEFKGSPS